MPAPGNVMNESTKPLGQPKPMPAGPTPAPIAPPINNPALEAKPMEAPMAPPIENPALEAKPMAAPMQTQPMGAQPMGAQPMEAQPMGAPQKPMMEEGIPGEGGMGMAQPMPKPLDEPITDEVNDFSLEIGGDLGGGEMGGQMGGEMGGLGEEMGGLGDEMGGLGDEMGGGRGLDLGLEGDTVTIELPAEAADALQILMDALQGNIGDEMIDTTGDDLNGGDLGVEEITEDTVDENGENGESEIPGIFEDTDEENGGEEEIPGLSEESDDELIKESEPEEAEPMGEKPSAEKPSAEKPMEEKPTMKLVPVAETEENTKEAEARELDNLLYSMKTKTLKTTSSALDNVFEGLLQQAKIAAKTGSDVKKMEYKGATEGDKIKASPAQDAKGIGKVKDGGKIQHEETFTTNVKSKPDVPRAEATIGDEGSEMTVNESGDLPTVPHDSPAMAGEEHYRPEQGNVVDGNQGGAPMTSAAASKKEVKTAEVKTAKCKCGDPKCNCNCNGEDCSKPCWKKKKSSTDKETKTAEPTKEVSMKTAKTYTVASNHKYYDAFLKRLDAGNSEVKLQDGNTYAMNKDENKIVLTAKISEKIKESQTVSPKSVKDLQDDPDINQTSGPGQGKIHVDKTHSLAVDEKKPSEGMDEPSVPEAPNAGQLQREHDVTNKLDGPTIPAGGGSNPEYDQNEKNDPEKLDQTLGKENDIAAMASVSRDEAVKIAGQMLKANLISIDELPNKVNQLSKATPEILKDVENLIQKAQGTKGMQRQASADSVETPILQKTAGTQDDAKSDLKTNIQSLFRLEHRNRDHERYGQEQDHRLYQ